MRIHSKRRKKQTSVFLTVKQENESSERFSSLSQVN
jgi:hypothetical protein